MLIGIDASRYRHEAPTGVELYSDEVIDGLLERAARQKTHEILLYTPRTLEGIDPDLQKVIPGKRLWTQHHLWRSLNDSPPDVLFVPSHVMPLRMKMGRPLPTKTVVMIHDVAFREFPSAYSFGQYAYLHLSTRWQVRGATRIVVPSRATAEALEQYYGRSQDKLDVIPHGFRPQRMTISAKRRSEILKRFHLNAGDPYVFFVGRLETKKNLYRLVQAFNEFHRTHPEWRLVLGGGRGVGFRSILKALNRERLMDNVLMPGYLTEEEKHVLMSEARIFAFPSLSEGFGFPILEAASYGVPIVASQIPALLEFHDLVDAYVDPHKTHELVEAFERLAALKEGDTRGPGSHKPLRDEGSREASIDPTRNSSLLSRYCWKQNVDSLWNILTSLDS